MNLFESKLKVYAEQYKRKKWEWQLPQEFNTASFTT